jgi:hypothetical protein
MVSPELSPLPGTLRIEYGVPGIFGVWCPRNFRNLYLGDHTSNAADSLRNGGRLRGDNHPFTKIREAQVREVRLALSRGERVGDLARAHHVHKSTISRIKHGVRRQSC